MTVHALRIRETDSTPAFRIPSNESRTVDLYRESEESAVPNLVEEFEQTISDIAMGNTPSTVTHVLLAGRTMGIPKAAIAAKLGKTSFQIEGTLALLEERGWVVRYAENGHEKYIVRGALRK